MFWRRINPSEDPIRLVQFLDATKEASWATADRLSSLKAIFVALDELLHHEVLYYFTARKRQRLWSAVTRMLAVTLGTAGVIAPLLAAADQARFKEFGLYGYVFIAAAASILVANKLFGATGSHIRYVATQFALERVITTTRLEWNALLARWATASPDEAQLTEAFALLKKFSDESYKIIQDETTNWGQGVTAALEEYFKSVSVKVAEKQKGGS